MADSRYITTNVTSHNWRLDFIGGHVQTDNTYPPPARPLMIPAMVNKIDRPLLPMLTVFWLR